MRYLISNVLALKNGISINAILEKIPRVSYRKLEEPRGEPHRGEVVHIIVLFSVAGSRRCRELNRWTQLDGERKVKRTRDCELGNETSFSDF